MASRISELMRPSYQGGTFITPALALLILGTLEAIDGETDSSAVATLAELHPSRYSTVQEALTRKPVSKFPPSRRSVAFSSLCVDELLASLSEESREVNR
jgi:hypothetical protein